jgi:flagellar hook-associated protein 2
MAEPLSSVTGISSGLDFRTLVDQIMVLERRPAARLQAAVDANAKRTEAFGRFRETLAALQTAADALKSGAAFDGFSTTSSGQDANGRVLVGAAAGPGAASGSYQVEVLALARAQKTTAGAGQASATDALNLAGGFAITRADGSTAGTVTLAAGDSLVAVRDKINALNAGPTPSGVQATILSAGAADQRLVLTATKAGGAAGFALADGGDGVLGALALDAGGTPPPITKSASDASLVVDGVPITRASNSVGDAVPGVTLTLNAAEPGRTATIVVERLANGGADAAKAFVDAYNKVVAFVKAQNATGPDGSAPPLRNDPLLRGTQAAIAAELLGSAAAGAEGLDRLGAVGITLQRDGTLAVDAAKFRGATTTRLDDLRALLADRMAAVAAPAVQLTRTAGILDDRANAMGASSARMTSRIADIDARLEKKRASLIAQFTKFEGTIGRLKSIGDAMSAQYAGLNKSNNR